MSNTTDADKTEANEWFFTENGQRQGPVSAEALSDLLKQNRVSGDTSVWRKGFSDWQQLRATELGAILQDGPPPVEPNNLNNAFVWLIAIAPLAYVIVGTFVEVLVVDDPDEPHQLFKILNFLVPAIINAALCLADEQQLKRAGYADKWLTLFGVILAPVYLFLRAKRLGRLPIYGFVWVASFIFSIYLSMPPGPR